MNNKGKLVRDANEIGVELNEFHVKQFEKYQELLLEWNEKINLTAITDEDDIITKHFIDSLYCLKYINKLQEIIKNPDYIGVNPNESGDSVELVKKYADNVLIGIKVDLSSNILYVSTMYNLQEQKLQRRVHSGRLIKF